MNWDIHIFISWILDDISSNQISTNDIHLHYKKICIIKPTIGWSLVGIYQLYIHFKKNGLTFVGIHQTKHQPATKEVYQMIKKWFRIFEWVAFADSSQYSN